MQHSRLADFWTVAGVLGTLAVLPYVFAIDPSLHCAAANAIAASGGCANRPNRHTAAGGSWAGLRLGKPIGLDSPFARTLVYRRALPALSRRTLISAALAGCATGMPAALLIICALPEIPTAGRDPQKRQPSPLRL